MHSKQADGDSAEYVGSDLGKSLSFPLEYRRHTRMTG